MSGCGEARNPEVTLEMDSGDKIVIELYPDKAPETVNNFISLIKDGFYDGLVFHRIYPGFMIQGGDPDGAGTGGPGYTIKGEFSKNGFAANDIKHVRGVVSMARSSSYDSAGSQFFIMVGDADYLDNEYAAFGSVVSGMDAVDKIVGGERTGARGDVAVNPAVMEKVTVNTFGKNYGDPVKLTR